MSPAAAHAVWIVVEGLIVGGGAFAVAVTVSAVVRDRRLISGALFGDPAARPAAQLRLVQRHPRPVHAVDIDPRIVVPAKPSPQYVDERAAIHLAPIPVHGAHLFLVRNADDGMRPAGHRGGIA